MNKPAAEQSYLDNFQDKAAYAKRGIIVFASLIFITCIITGCAHFFYQVGFIRIAQLCIFFGLGFLFASFIQKRTFIIDTGAVFIYFLSLSIAILVTLNVLYLYAGDFQFKLALSLTSTFALPLVMMESWRLFSNIPRGSINTWYYSDDIPPEPIFVYLENKPIQISIVTGNGTPISISSKAPLSLKLGLVFFYMIKEEHSGLKAKLFVDGNKVPYGWIFYISKFGLWKKYLHPEETLSENKISKNAKIIAKRL